MLSSQVLEQTVSLLIPKREGKKNWLPRIVVLIPGLFQILVYSKFTNIEYMVAKLCRKLLLLLSLWFS
jgi:hypothetical protein